MGGNEGIGRYEVMGGNDGKSEQDKKLSLHYLKFVASATRWGENFVLIRRGGNIENLSEATVIATSTKSSISPKKMCPKYEAQFFYF